MAVVIVDDDAGHGATATGTDELSWTHLNDGGADFLVVGGLIRNDPRTVDSATYNAISMTPIGSTVTQDSLNARLFGKTAPATGSNTVLVTFSGGGRCNGISMGFDGVDQGTPDDGLNSAIGNNDADPESDLSLSSAADDMAISFFSHEDTTARVLTTDDTEFAASVQETGSGNTHVRTGASFEDASGTATLGWNLDGAEKWVHLAVNINAAAAAADQLPARHRRIPARSPIPTRGRYAA